MVVSSYEGLCSVFLSNITSPLPHASDATDGPYSKLTDPCVQLHKCIALPPPNQQVSPVSHSANAVFLHVGGGGMVGGVHIVNLGHPAAEAALQLMRGRDEGSA